MNAVRNEEGSSILGLETSEIIRAAAMAAAVLLARLLLGLFGLPFRFQTDLKAS
jgi:hypothetical protein